MRYAPYQRIIAEGGANGEDCITTAYRVVPEGMDPALIRASEFRDIRRRGTYPDCPAAVAGSPPPDSPEWVALSYWRDVPLPAPDPWIAPGRAITGMYAYLETRGTTTYTVTEPDTAFGPLTITATGAYHVDWGDGTRTGPFAFEGEPWPDGRIRHEYIHVGTYDVTVTERWRATWSFGDQSGTLEELRTVGVIEDFPVQQIQAVVRR